MLDPKLDLGAAAQSEPAAPPPAGDDAIGIQEAPLGQLLESDEVFKGKWADMLEAGGDEVKRIFAPMVERAVKRARAGPYGGPPDIKQDS